MPSPLSAAMNATILRRTGGVVVAKGAETTYGRLRWAPLTVAKGDGGGGVLTAHGSVLIANGTLTGVTAEDGIGDALTVNGVVCTVIDIVQPAGEDDGDMLELILRRN